MVCNAGDSAKITVNFGNGDTRVFVTDKCPVTHSCIDKLGGVVGVVNNVVVTTPYPSLTWTVTNSYQPGQLYRIRGQFMNQTTSSPWGGCGTWVNFDEFDINCPTSGEFILGWYGSGSSAFPACLDPSKTYPNNFISFIYKWGGRLMYAWVGCANAGYYPSWAAGDIRISQILNLSGGYVRWRVKFRDGSNNIILSQDYATQPTVTTQTVSGGKEFKINDSLGTIFKTDAITCPTVAVECFDPSKQCPEGSCECIEGNIKCCIDPNSGVILRTITL